MVSELLRHGSHTCIPLHKVDHQRIDELRGLVLGAVPSTVENLEFIDAPKLLVCPAFRHWLPRVLVSPQDADGNLGGARGCEVVAAGKDLKLLLRQRPSAVADEIKKDARGVFRLARIQDRLQTRPTRKCQAKRLRASDIARLPPGAENMPKNSSVLSPGRARP